MTKRRRLAAARKTYLAEIEQLDSDARENEFRRLQQVWRKIDEDFGVEDFHNEASTAIAPPDSGEEFRYVRHADVARFELQGWESLSALIGTTHGLWSTLMRRRREIGDDDDGFQP